MDDDVLETIESPLRVVPVVIGFFFAFQVLRLDSLPDLIATNFLRSLVAFMIFWAFHRAVQPLSSLLHNLVQVFTADLIDWLARAIRIAVMVIGAAAILEIWGIQVGPIIAGFGPLGVAVALGAQDLFKNLIAGLLILAEKRFHKGDWINVPGIVEGTVETIGFRSTSVRRFDKAPVMVPNTKLLGSAVINFSNMTHRRIKWIIGVEYR
ncbi:MAG: mechanosensitive ion channel family protein [Rhodospirillaceae bacterium]